MLAVQHVASLDGRGGGVRLSSEGAPCPGIY